MHAHGHGIRNLAIDDYVMGSCRSLKGFKAARDAMKPPCTGEHGPKCMHTDMVFAILTLMIMLWDHAVGPSPAIAFRSPIDSL